MRKRITRSQRRPWLERLEDRNLLAVLPAAGVGFDSLLVDSSTFDTTSVLVRFAPGSVETGDVLAGGVVVGQALPLVDGLYSVHLPDGVGVEDALASLRTQAGVVYAQPNYRVHVSLTPNDPLYNEQYALNNVGQTGGTTDADIDAPEAWDTFTGLASVIVAVIDTGVDYNHPDLAPNMWTNAGEIAGNGRDDDQNGFIDDIHGYDFANNDGDPMDDYGHGTHVAGTIGAATDNGIGMAGVAWNVRIMALKFLDGNGGGTLENAILALNYAVANGATISNNSWGGGGFFGALHDAIAAAGAQDHIFVAAAGNDSNNNDFNPMYPATYDLDNIISVAATDHNDQLAYFSNYGANTVDLGAPGVDILSTLPASGPLSSPTGYGTLSGTSMATPHVAGVVALVRGQHPEWSNLRVIEQVVGTAEPVQGLDGNTITGGRLNAAAALTGALPPDTSGPRVTSTSPQGAVMGPVSTVRVTFNEAIDPESFTLDDIVTFNGPDGLPLTGLQILPTSNPRAFDLTFDSQSALGDYDLVFGPDITDTLGNAMNQDRDSTNGEQFEDRFDGGFSISEQLVFEAADLPQYIDWFWSTGSSITIDQDVNIGDLNITINVTHPYVGDLITYLFAPDGSYIFLSLFNGTGANFNDTTFDDEAVLSIDMGSAPYAGAFQPLEPLATFDGMNARGTWELWIDNWGFETGWFNSWSMTILPGEGGGGSPPPPPPFNNPPIASDDFAATDEDMSVWLDVLANDSDPDGDLPMVWSIDWTSGGTAYINWDETIIFTPDPNFNGTASFGYTITDGYDFASAVANITVNPINDAPIANGDFIDVFRDTLATIYDWQLTANDTDAEGDFLTVTEILNVYNGQVSFDSGVVTFTPDAGFSGWAGFDYYVTDGQEVGYGHVDINVRSVQYLTMSSGGTLTSSDGTPLNVASADIVSLVTNADSSYRYRMFFDGSDVGLSTSTENVDAFAFLEDGSIIVSTSGNFTVPNGFGGSISGAGEDLIQFTPSSLGSFTSGTWAMYFDGSDVGLSGSIENVDAVAVLPDGRILISTAGAPSVPGIFSGAQAEDLLAFQPGSLGNNTSGSWSMYFDGSDVGLSGTAENVNGVFVKPSATGGLPTIYLSTSGSFGVPGLTGGNEDVFAFTPTSLGSNTSGQFTSPLTLDASDYGLSAFDVDGFALGIAPAQPLAGELSLVNPPASTPPEEEGHSRGRGWKGDKDDSFEQYVEAILDWLTFELNGSNKKK